jgi:hypothetical protein
MNSLRILLQPPVISFIFSNILRLLPFMWESKLHAYTEQRIQVQLCSHLLNWVVANILRISLWKLSRQTPACPPTRHRSAGGSNPKPQSQDELKITDLRNVTPYSPVNFYRHFGKPYCFQLQGQRVCGACSQKELYLLLSSDWLLVPPTLRLWWLRH